MFDFLPSFTPFYSLLKFLSQFSFWKDFIGFCSSFDQINEALILQMAQATDETLYMLFVSGFWGMIIGLPIGILLFATRQGQILECKLANKALSFTANLFRAIPFIILIIWLQPFTKFLLGTYIGKAAIVPLSIGVAPLIARMIENALLDVPKGLIEASRSMGATPLQIIYKVLIPESLPVLCNSMTITFISLSSYIALAGSVGAGGLGYMAIQYGYYKNKIIIMNIVLILIVIMVLLIQAFGNSIVKRVTHH